ncbi:DNA adenine methylase [Enterobacter ludwigii]|uniref:DNA adenine methylase n=1 Tax=Enterobacter ludwigii TaxID=299767 RepID=UPI001868FC91|nr:Dam family site-specific DNA-(adenine-N6)-methyltransferase [Enterobacter ludwigii]
MIRSPIKWAGGKTRVIPELLKHLPKADCLIEPFVGSGTVFMNTDYQRYILCDSNLELINFFRTLTNRTNELVEAARKSFTRSSPDSNDRVVYELRRRRYNELIRYTGHDSDKELLIALLFLYLNRHCYNGVYRVNQNGEFNVPFGDCAHPYFPEAEMRLFAEKARDTRAMFIYGDFRDTIPSSLEIEPDAALYCDPPYIPASKTASFTHYGKPFTLDDHRALVSSLIDAHRRHGTRAVISNSDTPETRSIYSAFNLHTFNVRRSVSTKSRDMAGEVIGVLRVCDDCGHSGGGFCPDCGPAMGDATYAATFGTEPAQNTGRQIFFSTPTEGTLWAGFDPAQEHDSYALLDVRATMKPEPKK